MLLVYIKLASQVKNIKKLLCSCFSFKFLKKSSQGFWVHRPHLMTRGGERGWGHPFCRSSPTPMWRVNLVKGTGSTPDSLQRHNPLHGGPFNSFLWKSIFNRNVVNNEFISNIPPYLSIDSSRKSTSIHAPVILLEPFQSL